MAFVIGVAFYGLLPVFAPPIVLQADEIPRFLLGLGAAAVAGAVLALVAGAGRGLVVVAASVLVGASSHTFLYAVPVYGLSEEPVSVWPSMITITVVYLGVPAIIGAALVAARPSGG